MPDSSIDQNDESVRIAIRALGDMRNASRLRSSSFQSALAPMSPITNESRVRDNHSDVDMHESAADSGSAHFVTRVSHLPLVNTALRAYEHGKASSRVVKYGAEMMESSVKTISRPVIDRLPVNVNSLDEFACRQLDKLDRYRRPSQSESNTSQEHRRDYKHEDKEGAKRCRTSPEYDAEERTSSPPECQTAQGASGSRVGTPVPCNPRRLSNAQTANGNVDEGRNGVRGSEAGDTPIEDVPEVGSGPENNHAAGPEGQQIVVQRSRWQAVLSEAGGLSAALSEESMKRLKYCLHWLMYATTHIDAQILILRDFIAQLQPIPPSSSSGSSSNHADTPSRQQQHVSPAHIRTLTDVRRDIVQTIRQVVDVVSKYTGGALPEPARTRVRGFILKLPQRWASKAGVGFPASGMDPNVGSVREEREGKEREREERESVAAAAAGGAASSSRRSSRRLHHRGRGAGAESSVTAPSIASTSSSASPTRSRSPTLHSRPTSPIGVMRTPVGPLGVLAGTAGTGGGVTPGAAMIAAQRILTLATESLDMMRGVTGVVKDSLDRADAWVGRLRVVGIQRNGQEDDERVPEDDLPDADGREQRPDTDEKTPPSTHDHVHPDTLPPISYNRRGSLPGPLHRPHSQSFSQPPSYPHSPSSYHMLSRHQSFSSLPPQRNYDADSYPSPSYSASTVYSFSTGAGQSGSSVPSTPGSMYGGLSVPGTPVPEGEDERMGVREADMDIEGEASRMGAMSLAGSRRGSLAGIVVGGVGVGRGAMKREDRMPPEIGMRTERMDVDV